MTIEDLLAKRAPHIASNPFQKDIDSNQPFLNQQILGKKLLIIGGAGTIGSHYVKEILNFKPSKITIVDINENELTELTRDLRSSNLLDYNPEYLTYPVNLLSATFNKIFHSEKWDVIANFSAHKHVRSEKDIISIEALLKNNIFGAIKLLDLCENCPPKFFFSVSTDKAANPVNIMGASKSIMEKLIISRKKNLRVSTARFANVAFSNGSLLDGLNQRINKHQPISCPSDIKRFFVTPKQSGQICLLATFLGESGNIFFPKLDFHKDQIFFKDIILDYLAARKLVALPCNTEKEAKSFEIDLKSKKYPVYFFKTDTSGEKLYEEFYTENEKYHLDKHFSMGFVVSSEIDIDFKIITEDFNQLFENPNSQKADFIRVMQKYVPDFKHNETGKSLDQKM